MRHVTTLLLTGLILPVLTSIAEARTLRVPQRFGTIQEAVDAAKRGDKIVVSAGTYVEDVSVSLKSRLTISGKPGSVLVPLDVNSGITLDSSDRVTLKALTIQDATNGAIRVADCTRTSIKRCMIKNADREGIRVDDSDRTKILGNDIDGGAGDGIAVFSSNKTSIVGNRVVGVGGSGIQLDEQAAFEPPPAVRATVARDVVKDNVVDFCELVGVRVYSPFAKVVSNTITHVEGVGLVAGGTGVQVVNNFVSMTHSQGILVGADLARCRGNRIVDVAQRGSPPALELSGQGVVADRNVIELAGGHGVLIRGNDVDLKRNTIDGAGDSGISVDHDASANSISLNTISNCRWGISCGGAEHEIKRNVIEDSGVSGMRCYGFGTLVSSNMITDSATHGIELYGFEHTFSNNSATGSGEFDLYTNRPAADNTFIGNDFETSNVTLSKE